MKRLIEGFARTLLWVGVGAVLMFGLGRLYALTSATCTTFCLPEVSLPAGAVLGLLIAFMRPSFRWKPLEEDTRD